jgi:hypothetical protein
VTVTDVDAVDDDDDDDAMDEVDGECMLNNNSE